MPRSKKPTLRRKTKTKTFKRARTMTKTFKRPKTKTFKRPKTKTKTTYNKNKKVKFNSQYKTVEYPEYNKKSELVGVDLRNKVIHGAYMKKNNLSHAKLHGTKFVDCTFINVNFDHAFIDPHTEFIDCKFLNCKTDFIKYVNGAIKENFDMIYNSSIV